MIRSEIISNFDIIVKPQQSLKNRKSVSEKFFFKTRNRYSKILSSIIVVKIKGRRITKKCVVDAAK